MKVLGSAFNQEKSLLRDCKTSRNLREGSIKALVGRGVCTLELITNLREDYAKFYNQAEGPY